MNFDNAGWETGSKNGKTPAKNTRISVRLRRPINVKLFCPESPIPHKKKEYGLNYIGLHIMI